MTLIRETIFPKESVDAFGRLAVSNPQTIFDLKHIDSKSPELVDEILDGGATSTLNINTASIDMACASASDRVVRQTRRYFGYQPGKGSEVIMTAVPIDSANSNVTWRAGQFDDVNDKDGGSFPNQQLNGNGFFFQYSGGAWSVVKRSFVTGAQVDTVVAQASWNIDPLDGSGKSGLTIDPTLANIFFIDYEWLGVGKIRFGVYVGGDKIFCHEIENANIIDNVYMSRASLPIRYEITQDAGDAVTSKMICSTVISNGGHNPTGVVYSANRGDAGESIGGTKEPLINIRLKEEFNRRSLKLLDAAVISSSNANALVEIWLNADITGGAAAVWNDVGGGSGVEFDIVADGFAPGTGVLIASNYLSNNTDVINFELMSELQPSSNIAGQSDIITVAVESLGGAETFFGSINWKELI